ncbi:MAG TPA: preprotein translocase subunit SecY [Candidatus Scatavimonas merdigallinarum]|uniref:Protein translocase subunit SecY n=1 Tax=Candidatus Scatavimonas merdigallinarum TaxID=2840914 RepID=A0A9D1CUI9_9FIRM|nr:preprotein translocase subunit SecY [Candidatus Scatavimonas merdigallinarum]
MFKTIRNAWRIPDLRKKILFTLLIIIVFRIGSVIPVPFLDMAALAQLMDPNNLGDTIFGYLNTLSGGAFSNATLFAMSVTPYINASIIIQLLTVAIPPLERLAKEGEEGRKKIAMITRYATVGLGLVQGGAYYAYLLNSNVVLFRQGFEAVFAAAVIILAFTAGTALMMWLGEQINQYGIGNGISILLFAGIVARMPVTITQLAQYWELGTNGQTQFLFLVPLFVLLFLAVIWVIVFMNDAERRIPVQYAKRVVGRKMYGGQSSHLPIKVGLGGVLPIIFASSILSIPSTIEMFIPNPGDFWQGFFDLFAYDGWLYSILYFILIICFAYFYTTIQYNPVEMSNNLRQNNGTIPGIRPGKPTTDFIAKVLSRITLIGALFLAFIALLPIVYTALTGMQGLSMGGTSVIILVGVALDTVKQMESQMMMRHYKGFLD